MEKRPSHHFLNFTRKEKNGTIFLLFFILLIVCLPFFYSLIFREKVIHYEFKNEMAMLTANSDSDHKMYEKKYEKHEFTNHPRSAEQGQYHKSVGTLFYFDPNTLPESGWKKLGVRDKTIATIQRYLSKGGKFRDPSDLKRIWGLHEDQVKEMLPYIKIESTAVTSSHEYKKKEFQEKKIISVEINNGDSLAYISLPGIGPGYASRIIKFRNRLGGFYTTGQVGETFGLPDSTFQKIKNYLHISNTSIRKIHINTASFDELRSHPYIRYQLANAIIQYRDQHGNFSKLEDIKKIMTITDEIFLKIAPYLTVE